MTVRLMVVACALGALAAGCAASPVTQIRPTYSAPPRSSRSLAPAPAEALPWMNGICTIVRDVQQAIWTSPDEKPAKTVDEARQALSVGLGVAIDTLATAVRRLGELGSPPVDGAAAARDTLSNRFSATRRQAIEGKARLDALPPGDEGREVAVPAWSPLAALAARPFEGVTITDPMRAAAEAAGTNCVWITGWPG